MLPYFIEKLQVKNFRNLEEQIINFSHGINCIFGENGNGKTNILEAVYYIVKRKSFRKNASFPQMLGIDGENPEISFQSLFFDKEMGANISFSGKWDETGSQWYLANKSVKKKLQVGIVFINPFDSQSFHNSASARRAWIDDHLSQINDQYKKALSRFTKSLRFRNKLLSNKPSSYLKQIRAIDEEMAELSLFLTTQRQLFLEEIRPLIRKAFNDLFSEEHDLEIMLDTKLGGFTKNAYLEMCQNNLQKDEIIGHTHYGIHKDDYVLLFDGLNSFDYCSLGQQKMSYLSLLFAYIELFRYKFNSFPIVLLDDVSGELDKLRWHNLVSYLNERKFQVLITTANDSFKEVLNTLEDANKLYVSSGVVDRM